MENVIEIRPRRAGKTTDLIRKFITDETQSYFILPNHNMKVYIKSHMIDLGIQWEQVEHKIFVIDEFLGRTMKFGESLRGSKCPTNIFKNNPTHVYIDEDFRLKPNQVEKLLEYTYNFDFKIHGVGTSMRLYNRSLLDLVRFMKTNGSFNKSMDFLNKVTQEIIQKDYMFNFLTEPSFKFLLNQVLKLFNLIQKLRIMIVKHS